MNLVGKIFTVFILLMSVVFMAFTVAIYATQTNWRLVADNDKPTPEHPEGLSQHLKKSQAEFTELQKKKKDLEEQCKIEKDRQDKALATLQGEAENLRKERIKDEETIAHLERGLRDAVGAMKAAHETLANLRGETDQLRKDIELARADRDREFKKVVGLTDDLHSAVIERKRLEDASRDLGVQFAKAKAINEYFKLNETSMIKEPPPGLEGRVLAVRPPDLVEISQGSDDGLRKGHTLFVLRPGDGGLKYIGKITVMDAPSPNRAVCRIERPITVPIERGDLVRAKL